MLTAEGHIGTVKVFIQAEYVPPHKEDGWEVEPESLEDIEVKFENGNKASNKYIDMWRQKLEEIVFDYQETKL